MGQSGPYRGDPAGRALIEGNPNSDATQFMGGKQYLNNLFKGADAAAEQAYTAAKVQGFDDQAAHNFSAQVWSKYVSEWKAPVGGPGFPIPGNMEGANPYGVTQPGVGSGGAPVVVQPGANPLGATQPGANPYGATQPGTSPFATTQPGSPLATTVNPGANPYGATQPGANPYGATQPGGTALGTTQPGANPYGATQPGGTALGTTQPGANPYGATLPGGSPYGAPQPGTTPGGSTPLVPKPSGSTPIGVNPCGDARSGPCAGQTGSGTGLTPSAKLFGGMTGLQTILSGGK